MNADPDRRRRRGAGPLVAVLALVAAALPASAPPAAAPPGAPAETPPAAAPSAATGDPWEAIEKLVADQQVQAALDRAGEVLAAARAAGDEAEATRALIEQVKLTLALHADETAARMLAAAPRPEDPRLRAVVDLYYGTVLAAYLHNYSWEIRRRERVAAASEKVGEVDLESWTAEQIYAEAQRAFLAVWRERAAWGEASLGELAPYFAQNDFPPRIRGTLRDAVAYLWTDLLADSSLWRPEDTNGVYRLDLAALIAGGGTAAEGGGGDADAVLAAPAVHPLVRLAAVLGDLERWHRAGRRPEAALEARRARLARLFGSFDRADDRRAIRADLEAQLGTLGRRYEWWSYGLATLADWTRAEDAPDALVRARGLALEGARAHPDSTGGRLCARAVAEIEAPSYQLSAMASDGPGRRSIAVDHTNLGRLAFRAFRLDLRRRLAEAQDRGLLPQGDEVEDLLAGRRPDAEWQIELPPTPDYRQHRTYVTPPLGRPGLYVVVASPRGDFSERGNLLQAVDLVVSDLVMVTREDGTDYEVTVHAGESGRPLAGVIVHLYRHDWQERHSEVAARTTAADGRVRFAADWPRNEGRFLLAERGDDFALDPEWLDNADPQRVEPRTFTFLFTDRSVYRPGQTLLWKAVVYRSAGTEISYATLPDTGLTVELLDPNREVVASAEVTTNSFGTASGSFEIPAGRLLGVWTVRSSQNGTAWVRVEEYKRPTFEVSIQDPGEALRLNRPATVTGEARYYFGLPVTGGRVAWRVTREPVYPYWWAWFGRPTGASVTVAAGAAELAADGTFPVSFTPEADERDAASPAVTYRYRVIADVTDEGGETRPAWRAFRLGFVAVEAAIEPETAFATAGEPARFTVRRRDLDGVARPGRGTWRLLALDQPPAAVAPAELPVAKPPEAEESAEGAGDGGGGPWGPGRYETEGDRKRPRWSTDYRPEAVLRSWPDGAELRHGEVEHDADGVAAVEVGKLPAGAYRLRYATVDAFGARSETQEEFVVASPKATPLALPAVLLAERSSVEVGDTARLFVHSGLPGQSGRPDRSGHPMLLEIFRAGRRIERREIAVGAGAGIVEIPVGRDDRGGFGLALTTVVDFQVVRLTGSVFVPWSDRELTLEFSTFRDRVRPGTKESWRVTVRGAPEAAPGKGGAAEPGAVEPIPVKRGAAEVLAYMYDRSLDLFAPHRPADPRRLYPSRTRVPWDWSTNLRGAGAVWTWGEDFDTLPEAPQLHGDGLKFYGAYGVGGPGFYEADVVFAIPEAAPRRQLRRDLSATTTDALASEELPKPAAGKVPLPDPSPAEPEPKTGVETAGAELRSDFAETAFWAPHLLTGDDGSVTIEFTVPDSVTEWSVWAHAVTRDLRAGSVERRTKSVKELLVRPYLPRFLREGDRAAIRVVVQNAGEAPLSGTLDFGIEDPESGAGLGAEFGLAAADSTGVPFTVEPGGSSTLTFPIAVPARVGTVAFRAVARAGDFSDGELRPLPVLPGRVHLAQSRFAALHDAERRTLAFADLAAQADPATADPTMIQDRLVVTLDGQLFYGVLDALPYLVRFPYECSEQTLNRFLSTGIVASLYDRYPAVARMAKELSARETRLEPWDGDDPNRKMALEETPWLAESRGGSRWDPSVDPNEPSPELINVLDPKIAAAQRTTALAELEKAQTSLGGFPWWPGGPPSPFMTLYVVDGLSRALEFEIEVPKPMVVRAWSYLHRHYLDELVRDMEEKDCCWELVSYLAYVLSNYPDDSWTGGVFTADERRKMLEFSFRHWREHAPRLKAYLALALSRAGRGDDARLVFASVLDSAKTDPDLGTYWAPEEKAWLWYNDTVETHAFALRALLELAPDDARRHGLVQWLFLNKKLNHWKSTRATAEAIYALVHYLEREGALGVREEATVAVGPRRESFVFAPEHFTGKAARLIVPGAEIDPATMSEVTVEKATPGLLFASATWHFSTERLPAEARGDLLAVTRRYFKREQEGGEWVLRPLEEGAALAPGDQVEVQLTVSARHAAEYVHLRDPRGAGFEPETLTSGYRWDLGLVRYEAVRDSATDFFFEWLPAGEYALKVRLRANLAGTFRVGPATLQSMYAPEFTAYSSGAELAVAGE